MTTEPWLEEVARNIVSAWMVSERSKAGHAAARAAYDALKSTEPKETAK